VYLASPETCVAAAIAGQLADPRELGAVPQIDLPEGFTVDDRMIVAPASEGEQVEIVMGPNIKPVPRRDPLPEELRCPVLLKVEDNITTDHISPAGSKYLPLRSNVPALAQHAFEGVDPDFAKRALEAGGGVIVAGENYGQGSSREHAALCPMYLGVQAVLARSFARIHRANLVNFGIVPLEIAAADYEALQQGDELRVENAREALAAGQPLTVRNVTRGTQFEAHANLTDRQTQIVVAGGMLSFMNRQ